MLASIFIIYFDFGYKKVACTLWWQLCIYLSLYSMFIYNGLLYAIISSWRERWESIKCWNSIGDKLVTGETTPQICSLMYYHMSCMQQGNHLGLTLLLESKLSVVSMATTLSFDIWLLFQLNFESISAAFLFCYCNFSFFASFFGNCRVRFGMTFYNNYWSIFLNIASRNSQLNSHMQ